MKQLFNYCPVMEYETYMERHPGGLAKYLEENKLQGIELFVYGSEPFPNHLEEYKAKTVGAHLRFFPDWLSFWNGDSKQIEESFPSDELMEKTFGGTTREEWLELIKANIKAALVYEPEYMVWHVAHCCLKEIYTYDHHYSSEQVLDATIEVYKQVKYIIPANTTVLFENLWWPGLNLMEPKLVKRFFDSLKGENVGVMLDTGHLLNTNTSISNEAEGVAYMCRMIENLGEYKTFIKGIHLSCSLSGEYHSRILPVEEQKFDSLSIGRHIGSLDQHLCFQQASLKEFIELVNPKYVVHELFFEDLDQLKGFVRKQQDLLEIK